MTSVNSEPFRTQVPNIIDDLGLDPFERALYVHYKRTCGENPQGYSNETVQTIRLKLKMGAGQVSEARKTLVERGLIRMQNTHPVVVTVVDIWDLNRGYYSLEREYRPDVDGWAIEQIKVWLCDMSSNIHTANVSSHNEDIIPSPSEQDLTEYNEHSPSEQDRQPANVSIHKDDNMSSNIHTAKQRNDVVHDKTLPTFEILYNRWLDNNLGKLGPRQIEMFGDYYDEHPDWVSEIIDTTIGGKPGNPWQYFVKIINSWVKNGKPVQVPVEPRQNSPPSQGSPPAVRNGKAPPIDMDRLKQEQEAALKGQ